MGRLQDGRKQVKVKGATYSHRGAIRYALALGEIEYDHAMFVFAYNVVCY